ncbi:hypothetical protein ACPWR0_17580 [Pandoraea pneumonica]|uniref:hypothetical protein n=1 Tax=Pandoraea pneumonica TaxID=2508299 RepID=UPI003CF72DFD
MPNVALVSASPCLPAPAPAPALPAYLLAHPLPTADAPRVADDLQSIFNIERHNDGPAMGEPTLSALAVEHFRHGTVECTPVPVARFVRNAVMDLLTPREGCPNACFSSNAKLRETLAEILALHPQGNDTTVARVVGELGLPSLLQDNPAYAPGTLAALHYDVGAHALASGIGSVPSGTPSEAEVLYFGESELMFLDNGNVYRRDVASTHAAILDFHYGVAGLPGHGTRELGTPEISPAMMHLADFTDHLTRCQQRRDAEPRLVAEAQPVTRAGRGCAIL